MKTFLSIAAVFLFAWTIWKLAQYEERLTFVPRALVGWWVLYVSEGSSGIGPGAHQAGIIVYDMPDDAKKRLMREGAEWLGGLPPNRFRGRKYEFRNWRSSPIPARQRWTDPERCRDSAESMGYHYRCPSITHYFNFPIHVDREVVDMVDQAVFSSGAYYTYKRRSMVILIPGLSRVVYVYAR
ncbi:hypothetical protein [Roseibium sp.]|uniref:hypothetical protein n=1 Tax=Roseibium sp. TaxID=1936156 RepID=UPI003BAC3352